MTVAHSVQQAMKGTSWIRRMFEAGQALKQQLGEDKVFDFSLGNPILEPPPAFQQALREIADAPPPGMHRYMPNNGFLSTRRAVAAAVSEEQQLQIDADDVVMTVGAAGALHVTLHSILDPGDEVIVLAPYFVEYLFYVDVHQGKPVVIQTTDTFDLDVDAIDAAITPRTKAIIVNTPNNPTGRIYSRDQIASLAGVLAKHERQHGHPIVMMFDTPYARITYDGHRNPPLLADHPNTVICHSHSKDLGLPGERIGYLVISPRATHRELLRTACMFSNRVLGFINAPAIMQLALERSLRATVDTRDYVEARTRLTRGLAAAGYSFVEPEGAFYLFPRCPTEDDVAFTDALRAQNVLVVPGRGFGCPGHIRIAYCVDPDTITGALPHFAETMRRGRGR